MIPAEYADASAFPTTPTALEKRVVLITGASSGIGREVAYTCAQSGATVILLARDIPRLESVYDHIVALGGPEPAIYPLDLEGATVSDFAEMAQRIEADFGRLDGLLNNAGLVGGLRPLRLSEAIDFTRLMRVNLVAPWLLTQACLPLLDKASDPSLVFTLDRHACHAYWGAYGVAKAGLDGLLGILVEELDGDHTIRVNGIDPGPVETRMRRQNYPGESGGVHASAAEISAAFVYFLGADSRGVTGRVVSLSQA